jgi:hypothetical protein
LLGLACAACSPARPAIIYGPEVALTADDYDDIIDTWTRSGKVYRKLDNKLFATATYHAPEFRRAFAVRFPDIYGHGGKITRRELVDLTGGVEQYNNFFLAVHTPDKRWNDLARDDSIWHMTLRGSSGTAVSPADVIPIKMDENLRTVYPYVSRFDKIYLVRFPLTDPLHRVVIDATTEVFTLRIASALGATELDWQLTGSVSPEKRGS